MSMWTLEPVMATSAVLADEDSIEKAFATLGEHNRYSVVHGGGTTVITLKTARLPGVSKLGYRGLAHVIELARWIGVAKIGNQGFIHFIGLARGVGVA